MFYSICCCKKKKKTIERAVFHITFAPWSQNVAYRPSCFLGHMSSAAKLFSKKISENKELINCHAVRMSLSGSRRARTGISGLATPSLESQLNKSSHMIAVGSSEVL